MNDDHPFFPADAAGNVCECGLTMFHSKHFGGDAGRAVEALRRERAEIESDVARAERARREVTLATRVVVLEGHPSFGGRRGIVTYTEDAFATVQLDRLTDSEQTLPINIPFRYLELVPLVVPTFTSQEEADDWLERNNPVVPDEPEVPHFQTIEEADAWAEKMRLRKNGGAKLGHDALKAMLSRVKANVDAVKPTMKAASAAESMRLALEADQITSMTKAEPSKPWSVRGPKTQVQIWDEMQGL